MAPVREQPICLRQAAQQCCRTSVVAYLSRRHEEPDRAAPGVSDGVQLGIHATLGAPDLLSTPPFLARRLEAVSLRRLNHAKGSISMGPEASWCNRPDEVGICRPNVATQGRGLVSATLKNT